MGLFSVFSNIYYMHLTVLNMCIRKCRTVTSLNKSWVCSAGLMKLGFSSRGSSSVNPPGLVSFALAGGSFTS